MEKVWGIHARIIIRIRALRNTDAVSNMCELFFRRSVFVKVVTKENGKGIAGLMLING